MVRRKVDLKWAIAGTAFVAILTASLYSGCSRRRPPTMVRGEVRDSAVATYVAPGDHDQYYLFYSGGHSGNVFVAGVPSMRHIATIPVFTPYPGTGSRCALPACWRKDVPNAKPASGRTI
jgi:nitrous oxide reductase